MINEHEIKFKGWDEFIHDHTKHVRKEVNAKEIQDMRVYLVAMLNDFQGLKEEVINDTVYPPPGIFNKDVYVEFNFRFEFNTLPVSVVYKGCHISKE